MINVDAERTGRRQERKTATKKEKVVQKSGSYMEREKTYRLRETERERKRERE